MNSSHRSHHAQDMQPRYPRDRFIKGMLIGGAAAYLLTNEQVQRTAIKGLVQAWSLFQSGVEEVKERFGDAEAEVRHARDRHNG